MNTTDDAGTPPAGTPAGTPPADPKPADVVPLAKYNKAQEEVRKLTDQLAAARAEGVNEAGKWREKYEATRQAHAADLARLTEDVDLAAHGLDDTGREVLRLLHGKLPAEGRPGVLDYVKGLTADGADVPAPLRPYFVKADPAAAPKQTPQAPKPAGTDPAPKAPANGILAALSAAQDAFKRSPTDANRKALEDTSAAAMTAARRGSAGVQA